MAANDVYRAQFHFEMPSGKASCGLFYRESTPNAVLTDNPKDIANALHLGIVAAMRAILSSETWFTAIRVDKVHPTITATALPPSNQDYERASEPPSIKTVDGPGQVGLNAANALPSNNTIQLDLEQTTFSLRSNGRMNVPGIPEGVTTGANLDVGYIATCETLAAFLELPLTSQTDTGVWDPCVVSAKVRDILGPGQPKDWIGSIAPITRIRVNPIIAVQRGRTTGVVGGVR